MKKLGTILLTGSLVLGLAACGSDEEPKVKDEKEVVEKVEVDPANVEAGDKEFTITATNWELSSEEPLVVKKGDEVTLNLVNAESYHTVGNEELGFDLKADTPVTFTADTTGEFEIICTTICGAMEDHNAMKITLTVVE